MLIIIAETGLAFDYPVSTYGDHVESLSVFIAQQLMVPRERQIFLSERGDRIAQSKTFSHYNMSDASDNCVVFLFDTDLALRADSVSVPAPPQRSDMDEGTCGPPQAPIAPPLSHPLLNGNVVMKTVRLIPQFLSDFHVHAEHARACDELAQRRSMICDSELQQITNQSRALSSLQRYSLAHFQTVRGRWASAVGQYNALRSSHLPIIETFDNDLRQLASIPLHPLLQTPKRTTLLDCVPEAQLRSKRDQCAVSLDRLDAQARSLNSTIQDLDHEASACSQNTILPAPLTSDQSQHLAALAHSFREQILQVVTILDSDLYHVDSYAQSLVVSGVQSQSRSVGDSVATYDEANVRHTSTQLPAVFELLEQQAECVLQLRTASQAVRVHFARFVRDMSRFQANVSRVTNVLRAFDMGLQHLPQVFADAFGISEAGDGNFSDHTFLRSFPHSYKAALAEIARRRSFRQFMIAKCEEFVASVRDAHSLECDRRAQFLRDHAVHLPAGLLEVGWDEVPPLYSLGASASEFDSKLPAIEPSDLDVSVPSVDSSVKVSESVLQLQRQVTQLEDRLRELDSENSRLRSESIYKSADGKSSRFASPPMSPMAKGSSMHRIDSAQSGFGDDDDNHFEPSHSEVLPEEHESHRAESPVYVDQAQLNEALTQIQQLQSELSAEKSAFAELHSKFGDQQAEIQNFYLPLQQGAAELTEQVATLSAELDALKTAPPPPCVDSEHLNSVQQMPLLQQQVLSLTDQLDSLRNSHLQCTDPQHLNAVARVNEQESTILTLISQLDSVRAQAENDTMLVESKCLALSNALRAPSISTCSMPASPNNMSASVFDRFASLTESVQQLRIDHEALTRTATQRTVSLTQAESELHQLRHHATSALIDGEELKMRISELQAQLLSRVALDKFQCSDLVLIHNAMGDGSFQVLHHPQSPVSPYTYSIAPDTLQLLLNEMINANSRVLRLARVVHIEEVEPSRRLLLCELTHDMPLYLA